MPPIELKLSKFKDGVSQNSNLPFDIIIEIKRIAEDNKLLFVRSTITGFYKIRMQFRLNEIQARDIIMEFDECKEGSFFEINGYNYKINKKFIENSVQGIGSYSRTLR
ncbi:hypothetical protein FGO68_gene13694 [Halteria grandinella]|uniref:Uncharacterized protein n=1 Tax=Halteria grandinella TaxID=5974 RepID=A0A8J8NS19_HALGN|nr:hypothetical protein FGO68_gene13694 [Halteria grandinella]